MTSGGSRRNTLPKLPHDRVTTPSVTGGDDRLAASASGSWVPGRTSSMAIIAPRPRTSPMPGGGLQRAEPIGDGGADPVGPRRPGRWSTMVSMEARAATQDTGLPP